MFTETELMKPAGLEWHRSRIKHETSWHNHSAGINNTKSQEPQIERRTCWLLQSDT